MNVPVFAPSLLAGNHANLSEEIERIQRACLDWVHIDIMDGHFVPNLSFGPETVRALRKTSDLFFDVHLMLDNPQEYIQSFAEAGADLISIHVEPDYPVTDTLRRINRLGCKSGIAFNPSTPAAAVKPFLDQVDLALAMTVQPGFGGQAFKTEVLAKVRNWWPLGRRAVCISGLKSMVEWTGKPYPFAVPREPTPSWLGHPFSRLPNPGT